ncbi:MAG: S1 RNA-binding domain-containing protein [Peptococcaceae bacterium]|nr:S1 RNA-binding domain-containing protein [Peptococcaceae bacterium]
MPVEVGSILEGVVAGITSFGAFVQLPGGETGLVHISEIAEVYVKDVNEFLKANDRVSVKVISIDPNGKIGLSIKQAKPAQVNDYWQDKPSARKKSKVSFEDRLAKFMKESEERLQTLRRSTDAKRGGRGGPSRRYDW